MASDGVIASLYYLFSNLYMLRGRCLRYNEEEVSETMAKISVVLENAEDHYRKGKLSQAKRWWTEKLEWASYEMEDVMDVHDYLKLWRERISTSAATKLIKEVSIFFSPPNKLFTVGAISRVRKRVDDFMVDGDLSSLGYYSVDTKADKKDIKQESHSFVAKEEVIGREGDKKQIIDLLLHNVDVSVVVVVGVGGLGKTTLAQFVFNDDKIGAYFDHLMWASVSEVFDLDGILIKITDSVDKKPVVQPPTRVEPEQLLSHLSTVLNGKLFFLVLDDLFLHEFRWWYALEELLCSGARGSKILITTRSDQTANISGAARYKLQGLSDKSSWNLFQRLAFDAQDLSGRSEMVKVGREIIQKCGNVPLIIRLVANLLYQKDYNKWLQFQDENLDIMDVFSRNKNSDLFNVLKPSYDDLPFILKRCFAYCSLFPKGYKFSTHDLVHLWMAQGFIHSTEYGMDYCILELLSRCFFQDVKTDVLGDIISCRMDDMMLHLAQNINEGRVITSSDFVTYDVRALHMSIRFNGSFPEALFRAHQTRTLLLLKEQEYKGKLDRSICQMLISRFKHLRALDLHDCGIDILPSNVGDLIHLRYLDLSKNDALLKLPKSVTKLYHLQTLKLNFCQKLQKLPKDIGKLISLRCLEIEECDGLTYMPLGLMNLSFLCHLNRFVVRTPTYEDKTSGGIRVLKTLDSLRGSLKIELSGRWTAIVHEAPEAKLECKTNLKDLKIEWSLGGIDDRHAYYYYGAFLEGLKPPSSLQMLCIEGYRGKDFPSWARMDTLTSSLPNLVVVSMEGCRECKYLPPFGQLKFLKCLTLRYMEQVQHVENGAYDPQLSSADTTFFPSLEELTLHSFHNLKGWWKEVGVMIPNIAFPSFPRLLRIKIWNCPNLKVMPFFPIVEEVDFQNVNQNLLDVCARNSSSTSTTTFPASSSPSSSSTPSTSVSPHVHSKRVYLKRFLQNLTSTNLNRLHVKNCPSLKSFPIIITDGLVSSIQNFLDISSRDTASTSTSTVPSLSSPSSSSIASTSFSCVHSQKVCISGWLQNLPNLKRLHIKNCPSLKSFPIIITDGITPSIQCLVIDKCDALTSVVEGLQHLKALEELEILHCKELSFGDGKHNTSPPWNSLTKLRYLTFRGLPNMNTLPEGLQEIKTLKFLWISTCSSLTALPEWMDQLSSLQHLRIEACPVLSHLPHNISLLKNLVKLEIMECPKLIERCREPEGKDWPNIKHIPRVLLHKSWRYGLMNDAETTETQK